MIIKKLKPNPNRIRQMLLAFSSLISVHGSCQQSEQVLSDAQLWTDYNINYKHSRQLTLGGDMGYRILRSSQSDHTYLIRPKLQYHINQNLNALVTAGYFFTDHIATANDHELRLGQQFNYKWPSLSFMNISNTARFEERFFYNQENKSNKNSSRVRGKMSLTSRDFKPFKIKSSVYFLTNLEVFLPFKQSIEDTFIDKYRFACGFGHQLSKSMKYEINYISEGSNKQDNNLSTTSILRFRLFKTLIASHA